jgi:hypothetical protein
METLRNLKRDLWREGSPREREWTTRRLFLLLPGTQSSNETCAEVFEGHNLVWSKDILEVK